MTKKISCIVLAALIVSGTTACNKKENTKTETASQIASSDNSQNATGTEVQPETATEVSGINPLTGESGFNPNALNKRPVAVMVNNLKESLPQYGIDDADIIYETSVEGGITRLMAVYADYTNVPNVCSVRSCRYYYPLLALGLDAIYCHWGADQTIALDTLNRTGIDHLDGASESGLFYRDQERAQTYDAEHTGYLCGSELPDTIALHSFRTDVNAANAGGGLHFTSEGQQIIPSGQSCTSMTLNFSDDYFSTFEYDQQTGEYLKFHSGSPHMDQVTGKQIGFENVFAIQTYVSTREDGYLMDVQTVGNGTGYYASKGAVEQITWSRASETEPIRFYDPSGNELTLNIGESYFGIIGTDKAIDIS
jgi:hypothetical protein